ncbi:MAG: hypothetical protein GXY83_21585 [Rhodopirellula sp.]|nr:hypothetical protein [Rhodopirellula sp.]
MENTNHPKSDDHALFAAGRVALLPRIRTIARRFDARKRVVTLLTALLFAPLAALHGAPSHSALLGSLQASAIRWIG